MLKDPGATDGSPIEQPDGEAPLGVTFEEVDVQEHPQIKTFAEAALALRSERYWQYRSKGEQVEFLRALSELLTEVCYHLDHNDVLPFELLRACQDFAAPSLRHLPSQPSAEAVLMSCLDRRIEQLIAEQNESGNTWA
ncbi:hypothetical protein [Arthrobacter silvisoli]|uniref:hypothetical protein n=1 Tax=Arthrobacter silvisoli TaxID=2291022 RepID=UPI00109B9CFF|nr:hypothetical protein [Arthrobacter silvisoli]